MKTVEQVRQENAENMLVALSSLMGANIVRKSEFDKVNKEKEMLLKNVKDIDELKTKLLYAQCKLVSFVQYHSQWKPTTRSVERRFSKLQSEGLYVETSQYPLEICENLKEAYNCYINDLKIACYIMILRTIEIAVNIIYDNNNQKQFDAKGREVFVPAIIKLNWIKSNKIIGGMSFNLAKSFIESRNEAVHDLFVPEDLELRSTFKGVIKLVEQLKTKF